MKNTLFILTLCCIFHLSLHAQERYELELPEDRSNTWSNPTWKGQSDTMQWVKTSGKGGFFWRQSRHEITFSNGKTLIRDCPRGKACQIMNQDSLNLIERTDRHYVLKNGTLLRLKFNIDNTRIRVLNPERRLIAEAKTRHRILQFKHELYVELFENVPYKRELLVQLSRDILEQTFGW